MTHDFRLSRLKCPRGTTAAMLLLVAVFLAFGLAVETLAAEPPGFPAQTGKP
jgi:hypothetical protein